MAPILLFAGYAFIIIGGIMMLIEAFRKSVLWGLACLFVPIVSFFFLIVHWNAAKKALVVQLFGVALLIISFVVLGDSQRTFH